jgi:type IV pilus assembly protein PilP
MRRTFWRASALVFLTVAFAGIARAQGPARPQTQAAPAPASEPSADSYHYDPTGRRDPFVSLVSRVTETESDSHVDSLADIASVDVKVSGVIESDGGYVAMVEGPAGKTWLAHVHDRLRDGTIKSITLRELIIEQKIADPLSPVKQREIRKPVGEATK